MGDTEWGQQFPVPALGNLIVIWPDKHQMQHACNYAHLNAARCNVKFITELFISAHHIFRGLLFVLREKKTMIIFGSLVVFPFISFRSRFIIHVFFIIKNLSVLLSDLLAPFSTAIILLLFRHTARYKIRNERINMHAVYNGRLFLMWGECTLLTLC